MRGRLDMRNGVRTSWAERWAVLDGSRLGLFESEEARASGAGPTLALELSGTTLPLKRIARRKRQQKEEEEERVST